MAQVVVQGATCLCTFGTAPGNINPTNNMTVLAEGKPVCVKMDSAAMANITPFGMCTTVSNPAVAAATAAALGVLTPQPCTPMITGTWLGGGKVMIGGKPCLTLDNKCACAYGGTVSIVNPGEMKVSAN